MEHITLSQLARRIKLSLAEGLPLPLWVSAEIGEMKINRASGHCYLELVEGADSGSVPKAKLSAVVWRTTFYTLAAHFLSVTGAELASGMSVLLKVSVTYHELYGLSLQVVDIDPAYTLGEQERQRRETINKLSEEGVIDMNRSLPLPDVVQRVAVISSAQAAGYRDFMEHLSDAPYQFSVELFDAVVQGLGAEKSIVEALELIADRMEEFDAVVVIRGGGSRSDLSCFNSYELCYVAAQFPLPILTGIGHDKDTSVMDLIARVALKTPTAVADFLVDCARNFDGRLVQAENALRERVADVVVRHRSGLDSRRQQLQIGVAHLFERKRQELLRAETLVRVADPERLLSRGYAIVRSGGVALRSAKGVSAGSHLELLLADGRIDVVVDRVECEKE